MKPQKFQTKIKEKQRPLSKSKQLINTNIYNYQSREKNKLSKSRKKQPVNKTTSPDFKQKNF